MTTRSRQIDKYGLIVFVVDKKGCPENFSIYFAMLLLLNSQTAQYSADFRVLKKWDRIPEALLEVFS